MPKLPKLTGYQTSREIQLIQDGSDAKATNAQNVSKHSQNLASLLSSAERKVYDYFSALLENVSFVQIQTFKKLAEEHLEIENFKIFISEKALLNHLYTFQPVAQCGPSNQAYRSSLHC